ncbi:MAG: methionine ABC transporter ATP-binding protein [Candidatus Phytoplasma sp.]|nr:methionine ABC transporter ATP-binding protein [Phytoplasma sp.]
MIQIQHLTKTYKLKNKTTFLALDDVSLNINKNESLGIIGYSGAGKSTLLRMINLLIKPDKGTILLEGKDLSKLSRKELNETRQKIGMIFQNFNLLNQLTVYQNIKLTLDISNYNKDKDQRIKEVLTQVGLLDKKDEYPSKLSGGQKQRVGIARAIANQPKYLLCDEITSALDQKTATEIIELLNAIKEKYQMTIIFITHQIDMARKICDRMVVMEKGKIIEDQKTIDLFINPKEETTKQLIQSDLEEDKLKRKNVYQLIYVDNQNETILSDTIKKYQINTNILQAKTIDLKNQVIGYLIIEVTGEKQAEAINYLKQNGIEVKKHV